MLETEPTLPDAVVDREKLPRIQGSSGRDSFRWQNQTGGTVAITVPAGVLNDVTSTATVVLAHNRKSRKFDLAGIPGEYDYTVVPVIQTVTLVDSDPQESELFRLAVRTGTIEIV